MFVNSVFVSAVVEFIDILITALAFPFGSSFEVVVAVNIDDASFPVTFEAMISTFASIAFEDP